MINFAPIIGLILSYLLVTDILFRKTLIDKRINIVILYRNFFLMEQYLLLSKEQVKKKTNNQ
jgi:hypothetical protein